MAAAANWRQSDRLCFLSSLSPLAFCLFFPLCALVLLLSGSDSWISLFSCRHLRRCRRSQIFPVSKRADSPFLFFLDHADRLDTSFLPWLRRRRFGSRYK
ncbi:hypothetical protein BC567DRAFT_222184 [Phyllosticta citribraziliensis]